MTLMITAGWRETKSWHLSALIKSQTSMCEPDQLDGSHFSESWELDEFKKSSED